MKYTESDKWENQKKVFKLKNHYEKVINKGELSPLIDFSSYKAMDKSIGSTLHGLITSNGLEVKSHSLHFIDRVFGSIEERRSGVELKDVKECLEIGKVKGTKKRDSIRFETKRCDVSLNPITGNLIQTNPRKG